MACHTLNTQPVSVIKRATDRGHEFPIPCPSRCSSNCIYIFKPCKSNDSKKSSKEEAIKISIKSVTKLGSGIHEKDRQVSKNTKRHTESKGTDGPLSPFVISHNCMAIYIIITSFKSTR